MRRRYLFAALGFAFSVAGCEDQAAVPPPNTPTSPAPGVAANDPLGARPELTPAKPFVPPAPVVFKASNGMTVWLFERHTLPVVSVSVTIPSGSAADPKELAGVAHLTADMLDEGAGKRDAVGLSTAVNDLGASLSTGATADGSVVALSVLKKNFAPAFEIMSDVVARPRFEPKEFKRVSDLWKGDLKKRADDPNSVARVVSHAVLYGIDTPYGHPSDGLVATAAKVDLGAIKAFYAKSWRPDVATLVAAGDLSKDELAKAIESAFGSWKAPKSAPTPAPQVGGVKAQRPRLVVVDRTDAPQSVITVVREGVSASDPKAPLLDLISTALGGSFTSRLNQNLREDHGWTYGARSGFAEVRGQGWFSASAAVVTEQTGPSLKEMLGEIGKMSASGLTEEEFGKVKAQDRADLVQTYETVSGVSARLGALAMLSLPPDFDAAASRSRQAATPAQLAALDQAVDAKNATVIVVGPAAAVVPQLAKIGLTNPEYWDPEGSPKQMPNSATKPAVERSGTPSPFFSPK
jgi:zinc protease